jgi:hexosaminidase
MKIHFHLIASAVLILITGHAYAITQKDLNAMAANLQVKYTVVDNRPDKLCNPKQTDGICFRAEITLTAPQGIDHKDWAMYFSHTSPVQSTVSEEFKIEHINGDLHRIVPTEGFRGFAPGETKAIGLRADYWHLSETDRMPNYYLAAEGLKPSVIKSTQPLLDPETGLEVLPHVVPVTDVERQFKRSAEDRTQWATATVLYKRNHDVAGDPPPVESAIVPTPSKVMVDTDRAKLNLARGIALKLENIQRSEIEPALQRLARFGVAQARNGVPVAIKVTAGSLPAEAYVLDIGADRIDIGAGDASGAFYALQSLVALLMPGSTEVPVMKVEDEPRYSFRGMHLDVARNFHGKQFVLNLLDQMAAYKLNKFHLHLADDEGWRLYIPGLPELIEIGSKRCHDLSETACLLPQLGSGPHADAPVNGFYSIADYRDILKAASARYIQVIPSLDMPGHSRAAIKAMEARYRKLTAQGKQEEAERYLLSEFEDKTVYSSIQHYHDNTINVCKPSAYTFIGKVIDEMQKMHADAGQPLTRYHIGADETAGAWVESPLCKAFMQEHGIAKPELLGGYFIEQVAVMLEQKGIEAGAWSDGLSHTRTEHMPKKVQANAWSALFWEGHKLTHELANRGWDVIISTPDVLYFDFPYLADPKERGYYWGSRHTDTRQVFDFMPDNLPVHAEMWGDRQDLPMRMNDTAPLKKGVQFVGMQGHLWSETIRTDEQAEYMIFPRLLPLAERAWHKADWELPYNYAGANYDQHSGHFTSQLRAHRDRDWRIFANVLGRKELPKLDRVGIDYRIPTVGAQRISKRLYANIAIPGLPIQYRVDSGEWQLYTRPVRIDNKTVEVRALSADGRRAGRSLLVP